MPKRRIAEQPADLEPGVDFWAVAWNGCRWPLTAVSPISDFKFCGAKVAHRCWCVLHAGQAFQAHLPKLKPASTPCRQPSQAKKVAPTRAPRPPIPAPPLVLALQGSGFAPHEATDIIRRMLAAPRLSDRLAVWMEVETKLRAAPRDRSAPGRRQLRALAAQLIL